MPASLDHEGVTHSLTFPPRKSRQAQQNNTMPQPNINSTEYEKAPLQLPPLPAAQRVLISDATTTPTASQVPSETTTTTTTIVTSRPRKAQAITTPGSNGATGVYSKSMSATTISSALSLTEHALTMPAGSRRTSQPAMQPPLFQSITTNNNNHSYVNAQVLNARTPGQLTPLRASHSCVSSMSTRSTAHPHGRAHNNQNNHNSSSHTNNNNTSSNMLLSSDSVRSSLLRSHRLANPADAFKLRSSVVEAAGPVRGSSSVASRHFLQPDDTRGGGEEDTVRVEMTGLDFRTPHRLMQSGNNERLGASLHAPHITTTYNTTTVDGGIVAGGNASSQLQQATQLGSGRPPFYPRGIHNTNNTNMISSRSSNVSDMHYVYTHDLTTTGGNGNTIAKNGLHKGTLHEAGLSVGTANTTPRSPQSVHTATSSHTHTSWNSPGSSEAAAAAGQSSGAATRPETPAQKLQRMQREMTNHYGRWHHRRQKAACIVQRAWRCYSARQALFIRRQILYRAMYLRQVAAARCITGFLSGCLVRARRRALVEQRMQHDVLRAALERRQLHSVQVITRCAQGWLKQRQARAALCRLLKLQAAHQLRRYEVAAVLVQRWWKLVLPQKQYWRRRAVELAEEAARAAAAARLNAAATMIQKHIRGMQTRKAVVVLKEQLLRTRRERQARRRQATTVITVALREYAARLERQRANAAAQEAHMKDSVQKIEQNWRAALGRRGVAAALRQVRLWIAAACTLQRAWRRWYAQRELRYRRQLRYTALTDRLHSERREYVARLRLQCFARRVLAMAAVRRRRAHYGRDVFDAMHRLQAIGRGYATRRHLGQLYSVQQEEKARQAAAEAAQRVYNAQVIVAFLQAKWSAWYCAQRAIVRERERLLVRIGVREEMAREASALRIQRVYRCYKSECARKAAEMQHFYARAQVWSAIVQVQSWWRAVRAREAYKQRCNARDVDAQKRMEAEEVMLAIADEPELQWWHSAQDESRRKGRACDETSAPDEERWAALYAEA